jgi:adenylate kinase family enzyme
LERVILAGNTGSGKSTLAKLISAARDLPYTELDQLYWGPGFTKLDTFEADVRKLSDGRRWVTETMFHEAIDDILWKRADTLIWLDLPFPVVFSRVLRRTTARIVGRQELWNGNRERWRSLMSLGHPIPRTVTHFLATRRDISSRVTRHPDLAVIRFKRSKDVRRWVEAL